MDGVVLDKYYLLKINTYIKEYPECLALKIRKKLGGYGND